jgi:hypothetical protein
MPVSPKPQSLPSPWKDLLEEIDNLLKEPLELHCVGGFVVCYFYGFPRSTGDIDFYTAIPANTNLIDIAGEGTPLAKKHKVWLHRANVMSLPEVYETRLIEMFPGQFKNIKLFALDPYDLILSKLERNEGYDRDDADYLFKTEKLEVLVLRDRYEKELRPYLGREDWHNSTLKMWIDIFEAN